MPRGFRDREVFVRREFCSGSIAIARSPFPRVWPTAARQSRVERWQSRSRPTVGGYGPVTVGRVLLHPWRARTKMGCRGRRQVGPLAVADGAAAPTMAMRSGGRVICDWRLVIGAGVSARPKAGRYSGAEEWSGCQFAVVGEGHCFSRLGGATAVTAGDDGGRLDGRIADRRVASQRPQCRRLRRQLLIAARVSAAGFPSASWVRCRSPRGKCFLRELGWPSGFHQPAIDVFLGRRSRSVRSVVRRSGSLVYACGPTAAVKSGRSALSGRWLWLAGRFGRVVGGEGRRNGLGDRRGASSAAARKYSRRVAALHMLIAVSGAEMVISVCVGSSVPALAWHRGPCRCAVQRERAGDGDRPEAGGQPRRSWRSAAVSGVSRTSRSGRR